MTYVSWKAYDVFLFLFLQLAKTVIGYIIKPNDLILQFLTNKNRIHFSKQIDRKVLFQHRKYGRGKIPMNIQEAIEHAIRGNAILFVGSGFSCGARKNNKERIKNAEEFSAQLSKELYGKDEKLSLSEVASDYYNKYGPQKLRSLVIQEFNAVETTEEQRGVCSLNWRRIYTTNYDNVVEQSCSANSKTISAVTPDQSSSHQNGLICVHFNGYIESLSPGKELLSQLRLSEESYLSRTIVEDEWFIQFRTDVDLSKAVVFIGFSVPQNDIEISRLLFTNQGTREKCVFIVGKNASDRDIRRLERFGTVYPIETCGFWDKAKTIVPLFQNDDNHPHIGWALKQFVLPTQSPVVTGLDIEDLFFRSIVKNNKITTPGYLIHRAEETTVVNEIKQGADVVLLSSDIADGKSILALQIITDVIQDGGAAFLLHSFNEMLPNELNELGAIKKRVIVFIDNFVDYYEDLIGLIKTKTENITFLLTMDGFAYDSYYGRIKNDFSNMNYYHHVCSLLDENGIEQVCQRLDTIAGWGTRQGESHNAKKGFLTGRNCNAKLSAIILALYDNPQIGKKIKAPYLQLSNDKNVQQLVIAVFILSLIRIRANQIYEIITSSFGPKVLDAAPAEIRYYLDPTTIELKGSCTSIAWFILRSENPLTIVDVLCKLVRYLHESKRYEKTREALITFGKLQRIFSDSNRFAALLGYYSRLQLSLNNDPLFWLQFAICRNAMKDYDNAERYFAAAYSLAAQNRSFNTFQLDNAHASFLLDRSLNLSSAEAISDFFEAHSNVEKELQSHESRYMYYPYRTAKRYLPFYKKHYRHLIPEHQNRFITCCRYVLDHVERIPDDVIRSNKDLLICKRNLREIIHRTYDR